MRNLSPGKISPIKGNKQLEKQTNQPIELNAFRTAVVLINCLLLMKSANLPAHCTTITIAK